jgi:hypothetical protein
MPCTAVRMSTIPRMATAPNPWNESGIWLIFVGRGSLGSRDPVLIVRQGTAQFV